MKALRRIEIKGFASIREAELELRPVNVLIGPNGAGKSNLLSFLQMVAFINTEAFQAWVARRGGAAGLLHYGPKTTPLMEFQLEFEQEDEESGKGGANAYHARLAHAAGDRFVFVEERVGFHKLDEESYHWSNLGVGHLESGLNSAADDDRTAKTTQWLLQRCNFYHFHDTSDEAPIRQTCNVDDNRYLKSHGENLAAYLHGLKETEPKAYRRILDYVRRIAPFIHDFDVAPRRLDPETTRLNWQDATGEVFGPHQLSDGTLRTIALYTVFAQPAAELPILVAIDEPELGMHPAAVEVLAGLVRAASAHTQVILSTQSPALLDHFAPEDVVVVERRDNATTFNRLDPQALEEWLTEYTMSELFDKNVFGGRPR